MYRINIENFIMPDVPADHGATGAISSANGASSGDGFAQVLKLLSGSIGEDGKKSLTGQPQKTGDELAGYKSIGEIPQNEQLLDEQVLDDPARLLGHCLTAEAFDFLARWCSDNNTGPGQVNAGYAAGQSASIPVEALLQLLAPAGDTSSGQIMEQPDADTLSDVKPVIMELLARLKTQTGENTAPGQVNAGYTAGQSAGVPVEALLQLLAPAGDTTSGQIMEQPVADILNDVKPVVMELLARLKTQTGENTGSGQLTAEQLYNAKFFTDGLLSGHLLRQLLAATAASNQAIQSDNNTSGEKISPGQNVLSRDALNLILKTAGNNIPALTAEKTPAGGMNSSIDNALASVEAYGRLSNEKHAVKADLFTSMPMNRQVINIASMNFPSALSGEMLRDGGANQQQLDMAQVVANLTSTAGTARAAGNEAPAFLKSNDIPLFAQLAEAIRGQVAQNGQGQTHIRLQLHPASLGEVHIRLTYQDGNITTHFHAATEQARQAIESSIHQLRDALAGHQLNLQSATVSAGDDGNRWGQQDNQGQRAAKRHGRFVSGSDEPEDATTVTANREVTLAGGLNMLNHFA